MSNYEENAARDKVSTPAGTFHGYANDVITDHLINFGAHTRNELAMVLDHVDQGDVFVDIGAHIGTYAIPVARKLGDTGRVLAIEGSPATYSMLQTNVIENGLAHKIETVCAIVGNGAGHRMRRIEVEGHSGASHFLFDETASLTGEDAYSLVSKRGFSQASFIKVDVEGMELFVLQSLSPLIAARRPKLYIEINEPTFSRFSVTYTDVQELLASYNYEFFRNTGPRNSGTDLYTLTKLNALSDGGQFYDLLALPI